jgi:hypothetical protein
MMRVRVLPPPTPAVLLLLLPAAAALPVGAHPISLTRADVLVKAAQVEVAVEVMADDVLHNYGLRPAQDGRVPAARLHAALATHGIVLLDGLLLLDAKGGRLAGSLSGIDGDISSVELGPAGMPGAALTFHLVYPLGEPPEYLTFAHQFGESTGYFHPSIMQLSVRQENHPPENTVLVGHRGQAQSFAFVWDQPAPAGDDLRKLYAERESLRHRQRLGMTDYHSTYVFIHLTPCGARVELLMPVPTLETWLEIERGDPDYISVDEQAQAAGRIGDFFLSRNPVTADGRRIHPTLQRLDFHGLEHLDFGERPAPRQLSALTARVAVVLHYHISPGTGGAAEMRWDLFNEQVFKADALVIEGNACMTHSFSTYSPEFTWRLLQPSSPVMPTETGNFDEAWAAAIISALLGNIYRSPDCSDTADAFGARAVQVETCALLPDATAERFAVLGIWNVAGTVDHWGHVHACRNRYTGSIAVELQDGCYRVTAMNIENREQLDDATTLRLPPNHAGSDTIPPSS